MIFILCCDNVLNIMDKNIIKISPVNMEDRKKLGIKAGDTVRVWVKIQEKGKVRLQAFEGLVLAKKHGSEAGATFTVRKVSSGVGVERIFPLYSPNIDKIEIIKRAKVRRAKLYHIRDKVAKEIRRQMRKMKMMNITSVSDAEEIEKKKKEEAEEIDSSQLTDDSHDEEIKEEETQAETQKEEKSEVDEDKTENVAENESESEKTLEKETNEDVKEEKEEEKTEEIKTEAEETSVKDEKETSKKETDEEIEEKKE